MMNTEAYPIILLFGMPRSGTTWIGKIFDSHHKTLYRHEPDTWNKLTRIPLLEAVANAPNYCAAIDEYVHDFVTGHRPEVGGKLPFFSKSYSSNLRQVAFRGSVLLSSAVAKLNSNVRLPIIRPLNPDKSDDFVVVWKSIQLLGRMGILLNCLPNAKCIHILRHPCGYVSSVLNGEKNHKFTSHTPASEDYPLYELLLDTPQAQRHGLTMDSFKQLYPEERLAWRWVLFNEKAMDDNANSPDVKILKYEDMCEKPLDTARACFDFCGLQWCGQTEYFLSDSTTHDSEAYYSVFKNPETAANKWKKSLSVEQVTRIETIAAQSRAGQLYQPGS